MALSERDWMAKAHPDWVHTGYNSQKHPIYERQDINGNTHRIVGFEGLGHTTGKMLPLPQIKNHLNSFIHKCENGACSHIYNAPLSEEPQQASVIKPHNVGDQVSYQGWPHYVVSSEPLEGEQYYDLTHAQTGAMSQMIPHSELDEEPLRAIANILDPIRSQLPEIWDDPDSDRPILKPRYAHFIKKIIFSTFEKHGYSDPHQWAKLYISGSLTTFQYSPESDVDVNIFVDSSKFPDWSRSELVGICVNEIDGTRLPSTTYPLQVFVMPHDVKPADKYQPHIRSGYDIDNERWVEPPDKKRVMDIQKEENAWYVQGLEAADKMELLLRYEPHKALQYFNQIHSRRTRDAAKGDFGSANIIYKFLEKRGLLDQVHALSRTASFGRNPYELIPEQQEYLQNLNKYHQMDDDQIPLLQNPPAGLRVWRGEQVSNPENRQNVGRHWTIDPQVARKFAPSRDSIIWQGTLDRPTQAYPRDHQVWKLDHTLPGEHEIRIRNNSPLNMEGYWRPTELDQYEQPHKFWPYPEWPDNQYELTGQSEPKGWEFVPIGDIIPATSQYGEYKTPSVDWKTPEQIWEDKEYGQDQSSLDEHLEKQKLKEQLEEGNPWGIGYSGPKKTWWTPVKYQQELANYMEKLGPDVTSSMYDDSFPKPAALRSAIRHNKYPSQFTNYGWPEHSSSSFKDPGFPIDEHLPMIDKHIQPTQSQIDYQTNKYHRTLSDSALDDLVNPPGGWNGNSDDPEFNEDYQTALAQARLKNPVPETLTNYYQPNTPQEQSALDNGLKARAEDFRYHRKNFLNSVGNDLHNHIMKYPEEHQTPEDTEARLQKIYNDRYMHEDLEKYYHPKELYGDRIPLRDDDRQYINNQVKELQEEERRRQEQKIQHAQQNTWVPTAQESGWSFDQPQNSQNSQNSQFNIGDSVKFVPNSGYNTDTVYKVHSFDPDGRQINVVGPNGLKKYGPYPTHVIQKYNESQDWS